MKRILIVLVLAAIGLSACGPSASRVATAIARTEAARPTQTVPQPTATPACDVEGYWELMGPLMQRWDDEIRRLSGFSIDYMTLSDFMELSRIIIAATPIEVPDCLRDTHMLAVDGMWCEWNAWRGLVIDPWNRAAYILLIGHCSALAEYRTTIYHLRHQTSATPASQGE